MKNVLCLLAFLLSSLFIQQIFSQTTTTNDDKDSDYFEMLQEYQRNKNRNLIPKTIQFLNAKDSLEEHEFEILVGFWGALFAEDEKTKNQMLSQVNKLKSKFSKDLFEYLKTTPINIIYGGLEAHPSVNDMNWASYFATYNTKYLDNIIENLRYVSEKQDLQKYLTGISAKWSLCVNAKSYPQIKEYLEQQESYKKIIKQLLKKEPEEIDKEMESFLKLQKAKGIW